MAKQQVEGELRANQKAWLLARCLIRRVYGWGMNVPRHERRASSGQDFGFLLGFGKKFGSLGGTR
jgi:hypothetical protein